MDQHAYIVTYDIKDPKRLRKVFRLMRGYGEWLQYSVFQCRLSAVRRAEMHATLEELMNLKEDHVLILDLGIADNLDLRVTSLGKAFEAVSHEPVII